MTPECFDNTRTGWRFNTKLRVWLRGLGSAPGSDNYVKVRSPDNTHTDANAYYATPNTQFYLEVLASYYHLLSGRRLSVNDMSLRRGGLFDVKSDWTPPHNLHRVGTSADINKVHGDCLQNLTLRQAVDAVMPPLSQQVLAALHPGLNALPTHFLCESGPQFNYSNNIHINFDMASPQ